MSTTKSVRGLADVTAELLSTVLQQNIRDIKSERIGTGLVGECHRIHLQYGTGSGGPASVILKIASSDPDSRQTGRSLKLYDRESRFYLELAGLLDCPSLVKCYHTTFNEKEDSFYLLLKDVRPATIGNELKGATFEQAQIAMIELGKLQRASLRLTPPEWVVDVIPPSQIFMKQLWSLFISRYQERITSEQVQVMEIWLDCFDNYAGRFRGEHALHAQCLIHGDYRLDNMLFGQNSTEPFTIVDWQTLGWGPIFRDPAYFLGCALRPEDRRAWSERLLKLYYESLGPNPPFSFAQCVEGVREQSFAGLGLAFASPMILERTDRGDEMFLCMFERMIAQIVDLNALDTLPESSQPKANKVDPKDEGSHPPETDYYHNESWYFDFIDPKQKIGGWIRLGVTPNQPGSWYTALICGPDMPTIAIVDYDVSTVGEDLVIKNDEYVATHNIESPLVRYRATLKGKGKAYESPAALLQAIEAPGPTAEVELDLVWHTSGTPYQWQMLTRYEIPCTVSGVLKIDGKRFEFTHAPGQRDHSWGERDWWGSDWVYSAFHLEDGTHMVSPFLISSRS